MKHIGSLTESNCTMLQNCKHGRGMSGKNSESDETVCSMKPADRFPMDLIFRLQLTLMSGLQKGNEGESVEGSEPGLETKGWRRLNLCMISEHRCNTFVVNLCGYRLTTMFENYFKHGYIFRVDRDLLLWLHLEDDPAPSKAKLFSLCILQRDSLWSMCSNRPFSW